MLFRSPVAGMIGDRLTFVASFGFSIVVGYLLSYFAESVQEKKGKYSIALLILVTAIFSFTTITRNNQWKDHMTLLSHDMQYLEESAQAHNLLAKRLLFESFNKKLSLEKQFELRNNAIDHFEKAVKIYPQFFNPLVDLGKAYLAVDRKSTRLNSSHT